MIFCCFLFSCAGRENSKGSTCSPSRDEIRNELPLYYDFVELFKAKNYKFWNFQTYGNADKKNLPEKLFVIRHDVHHSDIPSAYAMSDIDKCVLGVRSSTFYVMLDMPPESERSDYKRYREDYLQLISYLKKEGFEIEPHVSPIDMYIAAYHPAWESKSLTELKSLVRSSYQIKRMRDGSDIIVTNHDPLGLDDFNRKTIELLKTYNREWNKATALHVQSYAGHGTDTSLEKVLSNALFLDQKSWLNAGVYEFDTYNSKILSDLKYLSDNDMPEWMEKPERIESGRYELLAHPRLWDPKSLRFWFYRVWSLRKRLHL